MPTTTAVASELRRIADVLDKTPGVEVTKPTLAFYHDYTGKKEIFLSLARVFPRPLQKGDGYDHKYVTLTHESDALEVYACIGKDKLCTLIEPAKPARYACTPLLSLEEEAELGEF